MFPETLEGEIGTSCCSFGFNIFDFFLQYSGKDLRLQPQQENTMSPYLPFGCQRIFPFKFVEALWRTLFKYSYSVLCTFPIISTSDIPLIFEPHNDERLNRETRTLTRFKDRIYWTFSLKGPKLKGPLLGNRI
jgi:hypothetical protein